MVKKGNPFYLNRKDIFEIEEFITRFPNVAERLRWEIFKRDSYICIGCGLQGTKVIRWGEFNSPTANHFDLTGVDDDGKEIMLTIDHRIPSSKGGQTVANNLDTMCATCNQQKADSLIGPAFLQAYEAWSKISNIQFTFFQPASEWCVNIEGFGWLDRHSDIGLIRPAHMHAKHPELALERLHARLTRPDLCSYIYRVIPRTEMYYWSMDEWKQVI